MGFSQVMQQSSLFTNGALDLGLVVKAASVGVLVVLILKFIKSLTTRSPYEHIPGPQPSSSMLGYLLDMHNPDDTDFHFKMTNGGIVGSDGLYISDPLALHSILVRDQSIFRESTEFSGLFGVIHHGDQLASVWGNDHKKQRKLMNPVFTAAHVSKLSPLFYRIAIELRERLAAEIKSKSDNTVDILDRLTRTALELISQGGIGHTFNSFDRNSKEFLEFHEALKDVLPAASKLFFLLPFLESWRKMEPVWFRRAVANLAYVIPWPALRSFKKAVDTMHPVCAQVFQEKKAAFDEGGIAALANTASGGRDLTTLLMQANVEADEEDRMPDEIVIANMSSIVLGGQETTSGAMSRLLDLMTLNPSLQTWLREEINEASAKKDGAPFDFYELNALPRLDATCREALRLFAPVTFIWRQYDYADTVVPLQFPIKDVKTGKEIREIVIYKGTPVYVGLGATNRSTALGDPTRPNSSPNGGWVATPRKHCRAVKTPGIFRTSLANLTFNSSMTFLGGGRKIEQGMKFALLEIKTVMSVLLPAFHFEKTDAVVDWRLGITLSPYVRGKEAEGPQVPMKVSLIQPKN
ncbi:cytochrome P450 [Flammula alnicola]|nr:cytochrome P450 [Flammula alnicola]